eukprot:gnl/Trimastix_PCT/3094.p1 GENE.gnl/Trimastix_PCT/3094~~gnl/Trimastix_PCT/3094.p1  ORF type:complete len:651 (+),score=138.80 gnl/Trimastix_PCT/3094:32-1954(+)
MKAGACQKALGILSELYGSDRAPAILEQIDALMNEFQPAIESAFPNHSEVPSRPISQRDACLITYADTFYHQDGHVPPFTSLCSFCEQHLKGQLNTIHILPFFTWDTDRGFSVIDYFQVDPRNGSWEDFTPLKSIFEKCMFDAVVNHASLQNKAIQEALTTEPEGPFALTFTDDTRPTETQLATLLRPRPSPVLTRFYAVRPTDGGPVYASFDPPCESQGEVVREGLVWTTFSRPPRADGTADTKQVDLNVAHPPVLLYIMRVLLFYLSMGAAWIRFDAIGYLWKTLGTECLHLPQTHRIIELLTLVMHEAAPLSVSIAEVNEPQATVLRYLGPDMHTVESDLVYQFTHFPLAVYAVLFGDARPYTRWLPSLQRAQGRLFVTVLGTHDGMGRKPLFDDAEMSFLGEQAEQEMMARLVREHGTKPNMGSAKGKDLIYEMCGTPWALINGSDSADSADAAPDATKLARYLAVVALGLACRGVPSFYVTGLLGLDNNPGDLDENRSLNRERLDVDRINQLLENTESRTRLVLDSILRLVRIRQSESAFADGDYHVLDHHPGCVAVHLLPPSDCAVHCASVLSLVNVTSARINLHLPGALGRVLAPPQSGVSAVVDLIDRSEVSADARVVTLEPYQARWLRAAE